MSKFLEAEGDEPPRLQEQLGYDVTNCSKETRQPDLRWPRLEDI
jgi:hypothetical protein